MDHKKNIIKLFHSISSGKYDTWSVFEDFLTIAAISISNSIDYRFRDKRENLYMQTISKYKKEDLDKFAEIFAELTLSLEDKFDDVLGTIYQELQLNNKWRGQFFTPFHISEVMASMTLTKEGIENDIKEKGYISLYEPCCGGGSMIIAAAKVFKDAEYNFQTQMRVTAGDIDIKAVYMTYIQCSLLGIEAKVIKANAIGPHPFGEDEEDIWYTPMVYINVMREKKIKENEEKINEFFKIFNDID